MVDIDNKPSRLNPNILRAQLDKEPGTVSLNRSLRWKQLDQIYQQNKKLIEKLSSASSVYNRNKWERDFVQNTYYGEKIKENSGTTFTK